MNQVAIKSDKVKLSNPKTPKFNEELNRRVKELQEYKGER